MKKGFSSSESWMKMLEMSVDAIGSFRKVGDVFLESYWLGLSGIDSTKWEKIRPGFLSLDSLILHDIKILKSGVLEPNSLSFIFYSSLPYQI